MSLMYSKGLKVGAPLPEFELANYGQVGESVLSFSACLGEKGIVLFFICNHCPYVQIIESSIIAFAHEYLKKGIGVVAISANDAQAYPTDGPKYMQAQALAKGYPFPYLYDETQQVARAYDIQCTPECIVGDAYSHCVYHGRFDEADPSNGIVSDARWSSADSSTKIKSWL